MKPTSDPSRRRNRRIVVSAALLAGCSGSGSESVGSSSVAPTPPTTSASSTAVAAATLTGLKLQPSAAGPLDRVDLTGLPAHADLADAMLWMRLGDQEIPVPLLADNAGPFVRAPIHPTEPMQGGALDLVLQVGDDRSGPLPLTVGALSPAPGAWDEFVTRFRLAIERTAAEAGVTFDQLQATPFLDVAPAHRPLKLAQAYLDDGTGNDLESLMSSPQLTDADRSLIDAVVARVDLKALLPESVNGLRAVRPKPTSGVPLLAADLPRRPQQDDPGCIDADIEVDDAADLAAMMTTARDNAILEGGAEQEVLEAVGTVTTFGGFAPAIGAPVSAVGTGFTALQAYLNASAGLWPSRLIALTADVAATDFAEDFQAPSTWSRVIVKATSTGWTATADAAATALSAFSTLGSFAGNAIGLTNLEGFAVDAFQFARDSLGNEIAEAHQDLLEFCGDSWDVDISGEPYSSGRAILERFSVDSGAQSFEPIETGLQPPVEDTLRIEANPDEFAGQTAFFDIPIHALPILLDSPDDVTVPAPGAEVPIVVIVSNAIDPTLEWFTPKGSWDGQESITGTGEGPMGDVTWTRTHRSATNENDFPYVMYVEPTTTTGLRADGEPTIRETITIRLADLVITPNPASVLEGESLQFTVTDRGGRPVQVRWTATGGTIASGGLYTAGRRPGSYTVTATSTADPRITATVVVEVLERQCPMGTWRVREQEFLDAVARQSPTAGIQISHVGGEYRMTFAPDGTLVGNRDNWSILMGGVAGGITVTIDAIDTGSWAASETQLTIINESSSGSVTAAGQSFDIGTGGTMDPGGLSGTGTFECSGTVLTLVHQGITYHLDQLGS